MQQRSPEWFAARCGKVTASRIADVVARTKTGWGASRANYMAQLIAERLTGVPGDSYTNGAMQWGVEHEDEARLAYEFHAGVSVEQVGIIYHPRIAMSGASPDGLVSDDGMLEIKCPNTATHIETLLSGDVADKYVKQMQWQMACAGRQWVDFASYDPRMPQALRLWVRRLNRDEVMIRALEKDVEVFLEEVALKVTKLTEIAEAA